MKKVSEVLKSKMFVLVFAFVSLVFGLLFVETSFTGNAISYSGSVVSYVSLVGIGLLVCFFIFIFYFVKKK